MEWRVGSFKFKILKTKAPPALHSTNQSKAEAIKKKLQDSMGERGLPASPWKLQQEILGTAVGGHRCAAPHAQTNSAHIPCPTAPPIHAALPRNPKNFRGGGVAPARSFPLPSLGPSNYHVCAFYGGLFGYGCSAGVGG